MSQPACQQCFKLIWDLNYDLTLPLGSNRLCLECYCTAHPESNMIWVLEKKVLAAARTTEWKARKLEETKDDNID